jgi:outer membrane lipoprotein-sorting protein
VEIEVMRPDQEEREEDLQRLLQRVYPVPAPPEQFASRLQSQLVELLPATPRWPEKVKSRQQVFQWLGRFTMRQRIAMLGGIGVAVLLGFLLLSGEIITKPASAMERMAENIRKAKSYKALLVSELKFDSGPDNPVVNARHRHVGTVYWLAPRTMRIEMWNPTPGNSFVMICPTGKPGITIHYDRGEYTLQPVREGPLPPLAATIEHLGSFVGQADRELGSKEINGQKVWGYQIDKRKIEPDRYPGVVEFWLDSDFWPISVRVEERSPGMLSSQTSEFQWNIDLDPKLFDTTPPKGLKERAQKPPTPEEQVRQIAKALRIYADMCSGHYPQHKRFYADVVRDEVYRMIGIEGSPTPQQRGSEKYKLVEGAMLGFACISMLQDQNPDFAYHGKTVEPEDKNKVLLRWKLDDGRYEIIFGNLHAESVTAERLRTLEGR